VPARNRALWLTLGALLVPLPALALTGEDGSGQVAAGPASLSVSSSLGSCGVMNSAIACQVNISFNELPNATSYTATITSPDGSVTDLGGVAPGGASAWVPYVGAGTYSVQVTAYGTPNDPTAGSDGAPHVIATGISPPQAGDAQPRIAPDRHNDVQVGGAGDSGQGSGHADGTPSVGAGSADDPSCDTPTTAPPPVADPTTTPDPTTTTPDPTGTTGPASVDPADTGDSTQQGVAAAAATVSAGDTTVAAPAAAAPTTCC
jgi:hypothetical protein